MEEGRALSSRDAAPQGTASPSAAAASPLPMAAMEEKDPVEMEWREATVGLRAEDVADYPEGHEAFDEATAAVSVTPPAAPAAVASADRSAPFSVGDRVKGRFLASSIGKFGTKWWPATVRRIRADSTYDLVYEDGDSEDSVKPEFVRAR